MYDNSYYDSSAYGTTSTMSSTEAAGVFLAMMVVMLVIAIVSYVVFAFFLSMIFKKAGIEGWKAWVPVYNSWVLLEMGDQPGWWSILAFIPFVNIVAAVFMYIAMYNIGLKFGKEGVFVLLAIFLTPVWLIWLAVDKTAVWKPTAGGQVAASGDSATPSQPAAM